MLIRGKIVRVISPTQVVLNVGARDGVRQGMRFVIYSEGEMIRDPETGENIEPLELVKGRVVAQHVQEALALAQTIVREEFVDDPLASPYSSAYLSLTRLLQPGPSASPATPRRRVVRRREELNVDPNAMEPLPSGAGQVRPGDLVRQEPPEGREASADKGELKATT